MFDALRGPITVRRRAAGSWVDGQWVEGSESSITIQASVQPARQDDMEMLPEGRRLTGAYRIYTDAELTIATEAGDQNADIVEIRGADYEVTARADWQNRLIDHRRYIVTRRAAE